MRYRGRLAVLVAVVLLMVVSTTGVTLADDVGPIGVASADDVGPIGVALVDDVGPSGYFFDDDGNMHEAAIQAIRSEGVTKGCNPPQNTRYCPDGTVTRGQMAAFLNRALRLPATSKDFFTDDNDSVFEGDINRLAASGITKGCNPPQNTQYCPDGRVTRGQMAAFLVRAFGYTDTGGGDRFIDDDDSIFEGDIDRLGTAGVTKGCNPPTNNRYCPSAPVRRDQMASFLTRALRLSAQAPTHDHSSQQGRRLDLVAAADDAGCRLALDGTLDVCRVATSIPRNVKFWVFEGFFQPGWSKMTHQERVRALAELRKAEFRLALNGTWLEVLEVEFVDTGNDTVNRMFNFQFPDWFQGTHRIVGEWVDRGVTEIRVTADVTFTGP